MSRALEPGGVFGRIYQAKCKTSGKVYVGQTVKSLVRRFNAHVRDAAKGSDLPFHRALRKYGVADFDVRVLEECSAREALNEAEARWIKQLGAFGPDGYNCTSGGEGYEVGAETKARMSDACIGKPRSERHKLAVSLATRGEKNPFYGKHHRPESIEAARGKISEALKGDKNPFFGKNHPPDVMARITAANRGAVRTPQHREAIRQANLGNQHTKGHVLTVEHKQKFSRLTVADVQYIRSNPERLMQKELAKKFNVTPETIWNVVNRKTWKDVVTL